MDLHPAAAVTGVQAGSVYAERDVSIFQGITPQEVAAAAARRFQSNIPSRRNLRLVGRDDLLAQILDRLGDPWSDGVIVLHGQPGVGKSELARDFARRHRNRYPGGAFAIDAGSDAATINLAEIGRMYLDLDFPPDLRIEHQCLRTIRALAASPTLLIFDNVRSLNDARPMMPPAGMPCHVIVTTVLDCWDAAWPALEVKPLSHEASLELVADIAGRALADRHGEKLAALAGGLPVQLVPASKTLAYEARRGRDNAIPLTLAEESATSFQGVYNMLQPPARLLLRAAARLNPQRIIRDELSRHLVEGVGWSAADFQERLDACLDMHVVEGVTELRMHQLFAAFLAKVELDKESAPSLRRIAKAQAQRLVELARSVARAPNRVDLAATLLTYPVDVGSWEGQGGITVEQGERVGRALIEIGRFADALPWYERAVAAKEKNDVDGRVDHESLGASLHCVGYCLVSTGQFADAKPWYERAVAASEVGNVHGRVDHESVGRSLHQVGNCLSSTGQFADAKPWYERAAAAKEKGDVHGRVDHRSFGVSLHQVGYCLSSIGQFADAKPWYERAVAANEKGDVHGRVDHQNLGISLHQVGYCLSSTGEFADAKPWYERAAAAKEKGDVHGRVDHQSFGVSLHQVGYCLSSIGQFADAKPWFERAIAAGEKGDVHGRVDHNDLGGSVDQVGYCLLSIGQFADAKPWYERAVAAKEKGDVHGRVNHESLGRSLQWVGYCLSRTGQFAEAKPWYERALAEKEKGDIYGRVDHASVALARQAIEDLDKKNS